MQMLIKRKLGIFGHIFQMNNSHLIKTVMYGAGNAKLADPEGTGEKS